jgi:diguanylate cyclase (GGDEF)-like protein
VLETPVTSPARQGPIGAVRRAAERLPPWGAFSIGTVAVGLLGAVDYVTGSEASFSTFYLAPIAFVTWACGRRHGLALAVLAAAVWGIGDVAAGARYESPVVPIWNAVVRVAFFGITLFLVHDVRRAHAAERELARRDPLTGVANGRAFRELLEREIARMARQRSSLTLAYVDLDRFKAVNDSLGHAAGDAFLRAVASRLAESLRAVDTVARLGGDEFALLLPDTDEREAAVALERCHDAVRVEARGLAGVSSGVGATIGAVVFRVPPPSPDAAIHAADERMYEAKRAGRNRVSLLAR